MINKPSAEELSDKADSVYTLVILAAQRARQINESESTFLEDEIVDKEKPVTLSLKEIKQNKVKFKKNTTDTLK